MEELIRRSPRGKILGELLECINHLEAGSVASIAILLVSENNTCLLSGKRHKLPSIAQAAVWSAFNQMRGRQDILQTWTVFIKANIPVAHHVEHELALQVILDRMLKKIIANKSMAAAATKPDSAIKALSYSESNAIRYMAGYVAVKLLRRYRKASRNAAVVRKRELFVKVLQNMRAVEQPGEPDSVSEYSTLWLELIDRGGLYHINDDVFRLIESIELVAREYLDVKAYTPGTNICQLVRQKVLTTQNILMYWDRIASDDIPHKYERYSLELLKIVTDLWVNIRGHSFAKGWTMMSQKKYAKGTRKSLKPSPGTD